MARRVVVKRKKQNKLSIVMVTLVVMMLLIVVAVRGTTLRQKQAQYSERITQLEAAIESENKRTEEIEAYSKYVTTKKYVEEVAKDKLGLVYDGEIIFKPEQ